MPKANLGLFDTPPTRGETQIGLAIVGSLLAAVLLIIPIINRQVGEIQAFVPAINSAIFVGELIIATMLYAQAAIFRSRGLTILASAYVFTALLLVPYIMTFPGVFSENGLLGAGPSTAGWLMVFRRLAFPLAVISYTLSQRGEAHEVGDAQRSRPKLALSFIGAVIAAIALSAVVILGKNWLPELFASRTDGILVNIFLFNLSHLGLLSVATVLLFRSRRSVLDMWLLVALSGLLIQSLLNLPLQVRFTLGWYALHLITLLSHLVVLVALIAESNRLYARLAVATALRDRERDAKMMTMDAVTAAISHEVGQPLSAVTLNASAGLEWLSRPDPNVERAMASLHETVAAGRRTFDVIKSVRDTFRMASGTIVEFDLNDLVRETIALLDRELSAAKIELALSLDDGLPPIVAHRVQIQRVLINLLTNAMESVKGKRGRKAQIAVRTHAPDRSSILVDVSDTGDGIPPEKMPRIFEPFFTTKSKGTGLGLSLSKAIIEEHGGRIWASTEGSEGITFHVRLPVRAGAAVAAAGASGRTDWR